MVSPEGQESSGYDLAADGQDIGAHPPGSGGLIKEKKQI